MLDAPGRPLRAAVRPDPAPGPGQVLLRVHACGVCRTDLHVVDGELPAPKLPARPRPPDRGDGRGLGRRGRASGGRRPRRACRGWAGPAASAATAAPAARTCARGRASPATTSTAATPSRRWPTRASAFAIPDGYPDLQAAPLLCAGLIGYRALRMAGDAERLGLYGFGAAAHIVLQVARSQGRRVFAFTRPGRPRRAGVRPLARGGVGGRRDRARARAARRRDHLRAGRRARARGAAAPSSRAGRWSAPGST